jgi:hypothetical protein
MYALQWWVDFEPGEQGIRKYATTAKGCGGEGGDDSGPVVVVVVVVVCVGGGG